MQAKYSSKIFTSFLLFFLVESFVYGQSPDFEKYAKGGDALFWVWVVVVSFIALILFASLLFSKKKDYTK